MAKITQIKPDIPQLKKKKRVAAYARVSMESERLMHSLSAQISYYSTLIQKNPDWEYAGTYADEAVSGTQTNKRENFLRLIADCEAGTVDIVLTKSISRFARNTVDLLETVRHLKELGVEVRFEKEGINSLSGDGEVMLSLLASFAQEESRSISENCKWGIRKRYENGEARNCRIYGYRVRKGKLEIKADEADVVREIFRMFLDGDSCYIIGKKLTERGIKSLTGRDFSGTVISSMLRQEKYIGCTLSQKYYVDNHMTHKNEKNKGELPKYFIEGTHPAIIDKETFDAVQQEFVDRYGVEIINGIADTASYLCHSGDEILPQKPHRKAYWSEEQRREHGKIYMTRDFGVNKHDFSHFIECEHCKRHLTAQIRHFVDGSSEISWADYKHNKYAKGTPKTLMLRDTALKNQIAEQLGWVEFDADKMFEILEIISVNRDMVTLHFKDGHNETFRYIQPKIIHRKRKEEG